MKRTHSKVKLLVATLCISACAPSIIPTQTISEIIPSTSTPIVIPTVTLVPTLTNTPVTDISTLSVDEIVALYAQGKIEYPTELIDSKKTEFSLALAEYLNQHVGHSIHITKTFKDVDYDIYWSPVRNQWRSDHNTPVEELDFTGDSFPELIAVPEEILLETINLPELGEKSLAELYQMSDSELKKYVIGLIQKAMKVENPNVTPEKLKQAEDYINSRNLLPVIIDPNNSEQSDIYTKWYSPAQGSKASIAEASVTFHDGQPTNVVLMPILNNSGEIICYVRIHQASEWSSGVTEFSDDGKLTTGGYSFLDSHVFGNTPGDSFAILVYDTAGPFKDGSTGPILEGEEGIGDANTIEKLKNAQSLEEVMAILEELRLIVIQTPRTIIERN